MGQLSCCTSDTRPLEMDLKVSKAYINANTGKKSLYVCGSSKKELQELMLPEDFKVSTEIMTEQEKATKLVVIHIINIE